MLRTHIGLWLAIGFGLLGCSEAYVEGQTFEEQGRFEQAVASYKVALSEDSGDDEVIAAVVRVSKKAARQHFERYQTQLAQKAFAQAYTQLRLAVRADPQYALAKKEFEKWWQVLIIGHIAIRFSDPQDYIGKASQMRVLARLNTPHIGRTLDAQIDLDQGIFFVEDTLYAPKMEEMVGYTLQSFGVEIVRLPDRQRDFTVKEHLRFVNFRTPRLLGVSNLPKQNALENLGNIRELRKVAAAHQGQVPLESPVNAVREYALRFAGQTIEIQKEEQRGFTPQLLHIHPLHQKMVVDFGAYQVRLPPGQSRWRMRRVPVRQSQKYYQYFAQNIALQPYFPNRGKVFRYP